MNKRTLFAARKMNDDARRQLVTELEAHPPHEAAALIETTADPLAFEALAELNPSFTQAGTRASMGT
jgi:hypothetical protein